MPKVRSLTGRSEMVKRWKIYPDGRAEDFQGNMHETLPVEVAFSPQCIALMNMGVVEIEELKASKKEDLVQTFLKPEKVTAKVEVIDEKAGVLRKKK